MKKYFLRYDGGENGFQHILLNALDCRLTGKKVK